MSLTKTHFKAIASILNDVKEEIHPQVYEDLVQIGLVLSIYFIIKLAKE